jgi:uncharacterized repeat protein (TIGR03803 family)
MKILDTLLIAALLACSSAAASAQTTIYSFSGPDGASPLGKLVFDQAGNLYGTTQLGGANGGGSVFELSPNGDGTWTETTIYSFCQTAGCTDGSNPLAALIFDAAGNLYGTAVGGGARCPLEGTAGCGVVFELSPPLQGGEWIESVLYDFCQLTTDARCPDGFAPASKLIFDAAGNLYGTADAGMNGQGIVFELSPRVGSWIETVLYSFCSVGIYPHCLDGRAPLAGVVFDGEGNLYGTTQSGGSRYLMGGGVVYKLTPGKDGWAENVVYAFPDAAGPKGGILCGEVNFDSAGNIYSTATQGGSNSVGVVFKLTSDGLEEVAFDPRVNGAYPFAGVLIDAHNGDVYGTASGGGFYPGSVFTVSHGKLRAIATFGASDIPMGALITDGRHLYGTTKAGGDFNMGSVFEVGP